MNFTDLYFLGDFLFQINQNPVFVPGVWGPYFSAMVPGLWLNEGGQSVTGKLVRAWACVSTEFASFYNFFKINTASFMLTINMPKLQHCSR